MIMGNAESMGDDAGTTAVLAMNAGITTPVWKGCPLTWWKVLLRGLEMSARRADFRLSSRKLDSLKSSLVSTLNEGDQLGNSVKPKRNLPFYDANHQARPPKKPEDAARESFPKATLSKSY